MMLTVQGKWSLHLQLVAFVVVLQLLLLFHSCHCLALIKYLLEPRHLKAFDGISLQALLLACFAEKYGE